ncbi:hypothetical protein [Pseudomonas aeruginosa]|uniref:hypothetical protein n=1 Tax=Pseudomonas aeruginosa TaxID=287 RepID=UPI001ADC6AD3|nr:hypothetical protein [Pseudomonas aeruginosa]MBO8337175.1 hypothetical protein [Pseudomonas aeruginosa]HCF4080797.1 hypothetical protein [Pseudomonas aeruginosa]
MWTLLAGIQIFAGLLIISFSLDGIAKQMKRRNRLYEAELRARGVIVDTPEDDGQKA